MPDEPNADKQIFTLNQLQHMPMLSRIADSLFWLNRYMERADGLLRLSNTHYILSLDKDVNGYLTWKPVLDIFTFCNAGEIEALENNTDEVLKKILLDVSNHNSLKVIINKARENARGVQDHITKEVWEEVNQMYHLINQNAITSKLNANEALEVIKLFTRCSLTYTGVIDITMSRGTGWQFMNLGKYIERCLQTIIFTEKQLEGIQFKQNETNDILQWRHLLLSLSGYELQLKTYHTSNYNFNVLHQIVLNENFTRSIVYSLSHIHIYLKRVTDNKDPESGELLRNFGRLYSKVRYMDLEMLNNNNLEQFLGEIKTDLLYFSRLFTQHFFSYT